MRSSFLVACLTAALLASCQGGPKHPPAWSELELSAPSENILWAVASQELQRMGFPLGMGADPRRLEMRSEWKTELAPFKGDGYRERAEVRFEALGDGRFAVEVRVEKEVNNDLVRPLDPTHAKWESAPDDVDVAREFLQRLRARLGAAIEVGEKPRSPLERR